MSEILSMLNRHEKEKDELRHKCLHAKKFIKIIKDHNVVGCGSIFPSVHVVCRNCGEKKIMFIHTAQESKIKIEKTLKRQTGIKEQRLGFSILYEWELRDD